jgi:hypothetical protein
MRTSLPWVHGRSRWRAIASVLVCSFFYGSNGNGDDGGALGAVQPTPSEPREYCSEDVVLSPDAKKLLNGFIGHVVLRNLKELTEEDARVLAGVRGSLRIRLTSLPQGVARHLAVHRGELSIDSLRVIPDDTAEALAAHEGMLAISHAEQLSDRAVRSLAGGRAQALALGVSSLSRMQAEALANVRGPLWLCNVTRLDADTAQALSKYSGNLYLGLTELKPDVAALLARLHGRLCLTSCESNEALSLTPQVAAALSHYKGELMLDDATSAESDTDAVIEALASHVGPLRLWEDAIRTPASAVAIARHDGPLSLRWTDSLDADVLVNLAHHRGMLTIAVRQPHELSADVAWHIARHRGGTLELSGPLRVSEAAARALATHSGALGFSGVKVEAESPAVRAICKHRGPLRLPGSFLRADTIDSILDHVGGLQVFGGTMRRTESGDVIFEPSLTEGMAERLAAYKGPLCVGDFLTSSFVRLLAAHKGDLALMEVPPEEDAARSLLAHEGRLFLPSDTSVRSVWAAQVIASPKTCTTMSNTTHLIGPNAAAIAATLATRKGPFSLPNLQYVSAEALRHLVANDRIRLPPLDRMYVLEDDGRLVTGEPVASAGSQQANAEKESLTERPFWHGWLSPSDGSRVNTCDD